MIVIVDYDTGNTRNVKKALDYLGVNNQLSADPADYHGCFRFVF
ncbi:imidazole glycerol phosphate synthase subunit HisH, partial [Lacticaseibacillus paracasei subsp. paracasei CNCM I-4648]